MLLYILAGVFFIFVVLPVILGSMMRPEHTGTRSVWLRTDIDRVWEVISNHEREPAWRKDLKGVIRLPDHEGREAWKEISKTGQEIQLATTEKAEKRKIVRTIINNRSFGGSWILELAPENAGTRVSLTENGVVFNPVFRFMFKVFFSPTSTIDKYLQMLGNYLGEPVELKK